MPSMHKLSTSYKTPPVLPTPRSSRCRSLALQAQGSNLMLMRRSVQAQITQARADVSRTHQIGLGQTISVRTTQHQWRAPRAAQNVFSSIGVGSLRFEGQKAADA